MLRLKKILVAVDGSEAALHALRESILLALWGKGRVTAITVAPPYEGDLSLVGVSNIEETLRGTGRKVLTDALEVADAHDLQLDVAYEEGKTCERIVERAEKEGSELIVLGRKQSHAFVGILFGGLAARIIRQSRTDVLVIPEHTRIGWERILLLTDGMECCRNAVEMATNLAMSYGGELKALHALPSALTAAIRGFSAGTGASITTAQERLVEIHDRAKQWGVKVECCFRRGRPSRVACDFARQQNMDIIVMGSHGKTGLKQFLTGRTVENVIRNAPCPVLAVKADHPQTAVPHQKAAQFL